MTAAGTRRTLAALTLSVGLLAGCSSSGSGGSGSGGTTPAGSSSGSSSVASSSSSSSSASVPATSSSSVPSGDSNSTFCISARAVQADQTKNSSVLTTGTPADVKKFISRAESELTTLARLAPASIKADVTTLVGGIGKLYSALKDAGYNLRKASTSGTLKELDTTTFKAATSRVGAYVQQVCKIKTS